MVEIILDNNDDLFTAVEKIREAHGESIRVLLPEDSSLGNLLSFKLLCKEAKRGGKRLVFSSKDAKITKIIKNLNSYKDQMQRNKVSQEAFVVGRDIAQDLQKSKKETIAAKKLPLPLFKLTSKFTARVKTVSVLILAVILLLLGGLIFVYFYFPTATINITVNPESLIKSLEVVASPSTDSVDKEGRVIPAKGLEFSQKGSQTTKVTGLETVGEKAVGDVVIYNKTDKQKKFGEDTKIIYGRTEGEDLIFLLDEEVQVPPREASTSAEGVGQSTITYIFGKKKVGVKAEKIGDAYNLKNDETFVIDDHPTSNYIAQSDDDFTGGSKKEVKVVTADDRQRLQEELYEKLTDKIKEKVQSEITEPDDVFREEAIQVEAVAVNFDSEVGEETEELTLEMEAKGTALIYSKEELNNLLADVLKEVVPERFSLAEDNQNISVEDVTYKDGELEFFAKVKGYAVPKIDTEKLKDSVKGKKLYVVQAYLGSLTNIDSYEIDLFPALPGPFRTLPHKKENITVEVTYSN